MAQVGNNEDRFSGEYMIQDHDHMSEITLKNDKATRGGARQSEQSQDTGRQQGGDEPSANAARQSPPPGSLNKSADQIIAVTR